MEFRPPAPKVFMSVFSRTILLPLLLLATIPHDANAIVATITNDLSAGEPGAILEISKIRGQGIPPNLRVVLNPGEKKRLSGRNIFSFTVARVFGDTKSKYVVACPTDPRVRDQITFRLTDIQGNSMPSGCVLERTGTFYSDSGMVWDSKIKVGQ